MNKRIFNILDKLNSGGMAEIFLGVAYNEFGFDQIVTIKRLNEKYGSNDLAQELFLREANILRKLNHMNINNFVSFDEIDGHRSLVMGFVHGRNARDLHEFSKKLNMRVSVSMAVHIATEVARGLHYCHSFSDTSVGQKSTIVHCDISPENVLLSYEGEVKIIDFGVAQVVGGKDELDDGKLKGKVRYMAPEFIKTTRGTPQSDIYSLGMVLFELLSGKDLYTGKSIDEIYDKKLSPPHKNDLMEASDLIDDELTSIVLKCIQPDPQYRYETALEVEKDLSQYFHRRDPDYMPRKLGNFIKQVFSKDHKKIESIIHQSVLERSDVHPQDKDSEIGESIMLGAEEKTRAPQTIEEVLALFKNKQADVPIIHRGKTLELDETDSPKKIELAIPQTGTPQQRGHAAPHVSRPSAPLQPRSKQSRNDFRPPTRAPRQHSSRPQPKPKSGGLSLLLFILILGIGFLLYARTNPELLATLKSFLP